MKETNYDHFAAAYSTENQGSLLNAYYERPAMLKLAGGVEGHQVLDAGCGSGPLMEELRNRGAHVVGFDASAAMIDLARSRLGSRQICRLQTLAGHFPIPMTHSTR